MKKILIISLFLSSIVWAQNTLMLFKYLDNEKFEQPLLMPDQKTPLTDSCLVEVCLPMDPDKLSLQMDICGDELLNVRNTFYINGNSLINKPGFFYCEFYYVLIDGNYKKEEPAAHCEDLIYLRMYDASVPENACYYRNSALIKGSKAGSMPVEIEVSQWSEWKMMPDH